MFFFVAGGSSTRENRDADSRGSSRTSTNASVAASSPSSSSGGGRIHYRDLWYNIKFSHLQKLVNAEGRYECPRDHCHKHYKDASSLQRHIR